jgi:hypothetical protein
MGCNQTRFYFIVIISALIGIPILSTPIFCQEPSGEGIIEQEHQESSPPDLIHYPPSTTSYQSNQYYYFKQLIYRSYGPVLLFETTADYPTDCYKVRFNEQGRPVVILIKKKTGSVIPLMELNYDADGKIIGGKSGAFTLHFTRNDRDWIYRIEFISTFHVVSFYHFILDYRGYVERLVVYDAPEASQFSLLFTYTPENTLESRTVFQSNNRIRIRWFYDEVGDVIKVEYYDNHGKIVHVENHNDLYEETQIDPRRALIQSN